MTFPLRRILQWLPAAFLGLTAAVLTAIPGNTVTFLTEASRPIFAGWLQS